MLSQIAIQYTLSEILGRVALPLPLSGKQLRTAFFSSLIRYTHPTRCSSEYPCIYIAPSSPDRFHSLLLGECTPLFHVDVSKSLPVGEKPWTRDPLPVLFWGAGYEDGSKPFAERLEDGTVVFYADILAATFFMLSRWEETVVPVRDQHDRFPATASVAYRHGFLDRPIVDEYALILQAWLKTLVPQWTPEPRSFSVRLSHDIDQVQRFPGTWQAVRTLGGDIIKRRSLAAAIDTARSYMACRGSHDRDPFIQAIFELAGLSERYGFTSSFYFMGAGRSDFDSGYDPASPAVRSCIDTLRNRGHEIGFHPGYYTFDKPDRFQQEKAAFDRVMNGERYGGRQHFLRFGTPVTWRCWEEAGMLYDSTMTYADHEGFRCGTCHPFRPFDIERDRELDVLEIPLIIMDGTLRQYRNLSPEQAENVILKLAERCKQVNGTFTLLWHNSALCNDWAPWARVYRRVLPVLAEMLDEPGKINSSNDTVISLPHHITKGPFR